ncbi:hypothetical protein [Saccharolobus caldissimus]|uniref:Uncharacterized protein n=1 Tax=Saccharolobus caldissimus TaxID=1702097 RepID=A0AAQ4CVQ8_9CREN|nr:hypothetical protein [Saccharolobus caldissimus]BDB99889.1 hypothetical protein SACC_29060 [Saccharolobus caldissimus]
MKILSQSFAVVLAWQKGLGVFSSALRDYLSLIIKDSSDKEIVINNISEENEVQINAIINNINVNITITSYPAVILNFNQYDDNVYKAVETIENIISQKFEKRNEITEMSYVGIYNINGNIYEIIKKYVDIKQIFDDMSPFSIKLYKTSNYLDESLVIEPYAGLSNSVYVNYIANCKAYNICIENTRKRINTLVKFFKGM